MEEVNEWIEPSSYGLRRTVPKTRNSKRNNVLGPQEANMGQNVLAIRVSFVFERHYTLLKITHITHIIIRTWRYHCQGVVRTSTITLEATWFSSSSSSSSSGIILSATMATTTMRWSQSSKSDLTACLEVEVKMLAISCPYFSSRWQYVLATFAPRGTSACE